MNLNVVSIYSGGGGIDIGFKAAGYQILFATDYLQSACDTLKLNNGANKIVCDDIRNIRFTELNIADLDVLVGGPPCPAYSKSRFYLKSKKRALEDENSYTLMEYFRAVEELKPKVFFFENVNGFVFKPHIEAFNFLIRRSNEMGYKLSYKVVNSADYGIPQIRQRFVCIGTRKDIPIFNFPLPTHSKKGNQKNLKPWATCKEVIGDLDYPMPDDFKMKAGSKHHDLLKLIPEGENYLFLTEKKGYSDPKFKWRSRYWSFLLKLSKDKPSWTIQASQSNNMGPFHWNNRFLRIEEIKRIQTFPDKYKFEGDYKMQWRQIGNAVPPKLSEFFAIEIKHQIFKDKTYTRHN